MKPVVHYIHVHKQKKLWTVHSSRGCFHFSKVQVLVPSEAIHKPERKTNPRFFMRCRGTLVVDGEEARIV